jgi:RND family efflux transporter MFP subunit
MNRSLCPACVVLALSLLAGCGHKAPATAPVVPAVSVSQPIQRVVVDHEDFTGRTDAVSRVDIRARVSGYLVKVKFKDGDIVKKDTLLYEIDPRPFEDSLAAAKGTLERLEAEKKLLEIQVDRYRKLAAQSAASQQDVDQYLAQQAENIGAINTAKAQVALAELNLSFTRITAPVNGKMSRTLWTEGNLVTADSTLLTTLMSIDPMYAYFNIEEPTLLRIVKMKRDGLLKQRLGQVEVRMGLADDVDRKFPLTGLLDFVNNTVDPQTGTMQVRGTFANPCNDPAKPPLLLPGLFVRVRLNIGIPHKTLLINQEAIATDQGQKYVYVIDKEDKVVYRHVTLGQVFDGLQAIESGLQPDDRVVVNGLQRVRPGIEVAPKLVDMAAEAAAKPANGSAEKKAVSDTKKSEPEKKAEK